MSQYCLSKFFDQHVLICRMVPFYDTSAVINGQTSYSGPVFVESCGLSLFISSSDIAYQMPRGRHFLSR